MCNVAFNTGLAELVPPNYPLRQAQRWRAELHEANVVYSSDLRVRCGPHPGPLIGRERVLARAGEGFVGLR